MARILIAEDEPDIRDLIAFTLGFQGHEVFTASNGEEAVKLTTEAMPDLILMDVRMPRLTGYEACAQIKATSETKHIPIIFLSAKGQESEIQTGLQAGAVEYLLKPFSPDQLEFEIKKALRDVRIGLYKEMSSDKINFDEQDDLLYLISRLRSEIQKNRGLFFQLSRITSELNETKEQLSKKEKMISSIDETFQDVSSPSRSSGLANFLLSLSRFFRLPSSSIQSHQTLASEQFPQAELSRITDGIVHDMRNGLGIIRNTIGFMNDDLTDTPHAKDVQKISRSLDFCEVVLRNLSALGGQEVMRPEDVDLETIVRDVCFMLENKLVDVSLVIDTGETKPIIRADEGHMKQVFMNLIKNAGEAMPDGGTLTCRFRWQGAMMRIDIQDTGRGISKENQSHLFREFFTTKERGYGIGLMVVHTIIERHSGKISVKSKVGEGTTFTLLLPVAGV